MIGARRNDRRRAQYAEHQPPEPLTVPRSRRYQRLAAWYNPMTLGTLACKSRMRASPEG
jgi:hypothetical protein